jgi:hypothetical protein
MPATTPKLLLPYPLGTDPIADGDDSIKALAERVETIWTGAWTAATLLGGWGNHSAGEYAGYRLVGGTVELRGLIASGAIGQACLTLPTALRPAKDRYLVTASNNLFGMIIAYANGNVVPAVGSNTWVSLDVRFGL